MMRWAQHWPSSETESSEAVYRCSIDLGDRVVDLHTSPAALRALCHLLVEYLPFEELPYTTDRLMERGGDYFPEFRGWKEISADNADGAWVIVGRGEGETLRLASSV